MAAHELPKMTENEPIVKNFDTFLSYLKENRVSLSRNKQYLTKKTTEHMKQSLSHPENVSEEVYFYYLFNLFFSVAIEGGLFIKTCQLQLQETERLREYEQLTPTEKYFFMLETLWVDVNWEEQLYYTTSLVPHGQPAIEYLAKMPAGKVISEKNLKGPLTYLRRTLLPVYLSLFCLIQANYRGALDGRGQFYTMDSMTVTERGRFILPILAKERNLHKWNTPYRRERTGKHVLTSTGSHKEPFCAPFQNIFKEDLQNSLPRDEKSTAGTFVFKVHSGVKRWRTIKTSGEHTLDDLHEAIQEAVDFDRDHLYAFFMDGKPWSHQGIFAPRNGEGPFAHEVQIGELRLFPGQRFLYIFDFGSEWRFMIEVVDIREEPGPSQPEIIESEGRNPEQYPSYEDEDEDDFEEEP